MCIYFGLYFYVVHLQMEIECVFNFFDVCWVLNVYNGKMKKLFRIVWLFKGMCVHLFVSLNVNLCLCLWSYVYVFKGLLIFLLMSLKVSLCLWRSIVYLSINVYLTLKFSWLGFIRFKVCLCFWGLWDSRLINVQMIKDMYMFERNLGLAYLHLGLCVTLKGLFFWSIWSTLHRSKIVEKLDAKE
jgi:hypothetical protein